MAAKKKYSKEYIEDCSYRELQKISKSLGLPCNFKKIYLKELILAKYVKSERELQERINYIKLERKKLSLQRKTLSENSYFKDRENSVRMMPPPIVTPPTRIYRTRNFSSQFKNVLIKFRPETLQRRNTSPPRTYLPSKLINVKKEITVKEEEVDLNYKSTKILDGDKNSNNDVTENIAPKACDSENEPNGAQKEPEKDIENTEDIENNFEMITSSKITIDENYPSTSSQESHSSYKNVSEMCKTLLQTNVKQNVHQPHIKTDVDSATDSLELNQHFSDIMDIINNNTNNEETNIKQEPNIETNSQTGKENDIVTYSLPKFADAFANICSFPWINNMQVDNGSEIKGECYNNDNPQSILDFPDEFGFQNSYIKVEESNNALELLDSYMESPDTADESVTVSDLVDQLYGQSSHHNVRTSHRDGGETFFDFI